MSVGIRHGLSFSTECASAGPPLVLTQTNVSRPPQAHRSSLSRSVRELSLWAAANSQLVSSGCFWTWYSQALYLSPSLCMRGCSWERGHCHLSSLPSNGSQFCDQIIGWHIICSCCDLVDNYTFTSYNWLQQPPAYNLPVISQREGQRANVSENIGNKWKIFVSVGWPAQHCWNSRGNPSALCSANRIKRFPFGPFSRPEWRPPLCLVCSFSSNQLPAILFRFTVTLSPKIHWVQRRHWKWRGWMPATLFEGSWN